MRCTAPARLPSATLGRRSSPSLPRRSATPKPPLPGRNLARGVRSLEARGMAQALGSHALSPLVAAHPAAADLLCAGLAAAGSAGGYALGRAALASAHRQTYALHLALLGGMAGTLLPLAADHPRGSVCVFALSLSVVDHVVAPSILPHHRPETAHDLLLLADLFLPVLLGSASLLVGG